MKEFFLFAIMCIAFCEAKGQIDIKFDPPVSSESVKESKTSPSIMVLSHDFKDNSYSYIGYSNNSRRVMYSNAKEWVAKNFGDYNRVTKLDDANDFKLIIKGKLPERKDLDTDNTNADKMQLTYLVNQAEFTLTIEAREGRYRLFIEDMAVNCRVEKEVKLRKTSGSSKLVSMSDFCSSFTNFASLVKYDLQKLLESAKRAIEKKKVEDDW